MAEFNIRTDSVDVEQIMRQIRARIQEKRGVDYTEQQIQELANVKLQRFLDPKGVRSDLVDQFKRTRGMSPEPPNYGFEDTTLYETHRGVVRFFRRLLHPFLKLLFNPNPIVHVLHLQGQINNINAQQFRVREELDALYYEVIHNLVLEVTRLGIESKNMKMRLESMSSRMDFDERRARALEGVVQYKAGTGPAREPAVFASSSGSVAPASTPVPQSRPPRPVYEPSPAPDAVKVPVPSASAVAPVPAESQPPAEGQATGTARRRRRRRRGRRGGRGRGDATAPGTAGEAQGEAGTPPHGDDTGSAALGAEGSPAHEPQSEFYDSEGNSGDADADEGPEPPDQGPHRGGSRDGDPEQ